MSDESASEDEESDEEVDIIAKVGSILDGLSLKEDSSTGEENGHQNGSSETAAVYSGRDESVPKSSVCCDESNDHELEEKKSAVAEEAIGSHRNGLEAKSERDSKRAAVADQPPPQDHNVTVIVTDAASEDSKPNSSRDSDPVAMVESASPPPQPPMLSVPEQFNYSLSTCSELSELEEDDEEGNCGFYELECDNCLDHGNSNKREEKKEGFRQLIALI